MVLKKLIKAVMLISLGFIVIFSVLTFLYHQGTGTITDTAGWGLVLTVIFSAVVFIWSIMLYYIFYGTRTYFVSIPRPPRVSRPKGLSSITVRLRDR